VKLAGGQVAAHRQTGRSIAHSASTRDAITSELYSDGGGVPRWVCDATLGPQGETSWVQGNVCQEACHHAIIAVYCLYASKRPG